MQEEPSSSNHKRKSSPQNPESLIDRLSNQSIRIDSDSTSKKGKEPYPRPHPRFSPPHNKDAYQKHVEFVREASIANRRSGTPPGSPPLSPRSSKFDDSSSRLHHPSSSFKKSSRTERAQPPPIRKVPSDRPLTPSLKRGRVFDDTHSSDSSSSQTIDKKKRRSQQIDISRNSSSSSSEDDVSKPTLLIPQPQVNFVAKVKQHYEFQEKAKSRCLKNYSKGARRLQSRVVQHLSDIKQAVNASNTCGVKPTDFPSDLTRDLLSYNFIDIEVIYAHNLARKSKNHVYDSDEKSTSNKIKPVPVNHFGHWLKIIDTLCDAYVAAFPSLEKHFVAYFDDLLSLTKGFSETATWDTIRDYDIEMRLEFAARPGLTFRDFEHREVNSIKNRVLYLSHLKPSVAARQLLKVSSSNSHQKSIKQPSSSSKTKGRKNRSKKMSFPYELKDSSAWEISDQPCDLWNASICP